MLDDALHTVGEITSGRRRWQWLTVSLVKSDSLFHDLAEFLEDSLLVVAMAAAKDQTPGALPT